MSTNLLYLWYDTEGTGLRVLDDAIIAFGCVLTKYTYDTEQRKAVFVPITEFHTYISTNRHLDGRAEAVHGITKSMLAGAPSFPEAMTLLKNTLKPHIQGAKVVFCAYNGKGYDDPILFSNFFRNQMKFSTFMQDLNVIGFVDALDIIKDLRASGVLPEAKSEQGIANMKLGSCHFTYCGVPIQNAHDALNDARAVVNVFNSDCVAKHLNTVVLGKKMETLKKTMDRLQSKATTLINQRQSQLKRAPVIVATPTSTNSNIDHICNEQATRTESAASNRPYPYHTCLKCMHVVHLKDEAHVCMLPPMFSSNTLTILA